MVVLYVKIFLAIKRRSKEMEKMTAFQSKYLSKLAKKHFPSLITLLFGNKLSQFLFTRK